MTYGSGSSDPTDLLSFFDANNVVDIIKQATQSFLDYLKAVYEHPEEFLSLTIVEFLAQVENLVLVLLDILDDLIQAFLGVIEQALGGFANIFNHSLDIPIISALYKFLFHEDLTVLHVCTLLIAIPLTILYKLMHGGQAPFSGVDAKALRRLAVNKGSVDAETLLAQASPASLPISRPAVEGHLPRRRPVQYSGRRYWGCRHHRIRTEWLGGVETQHRRHVHDPALRLLDVHYAGELVANCARGLPEREFSSRYERR